ncbi:MAG: hypothetical protein ACKVZJ_02720 [Phycisphaerales bacterium]
MAKNKYPGGRLAAACGWAGFFVSVSGAIAQTITPVTTGCGNPVARALGPTGNAIAGDGCGPWVWTSGQGFSFLPGSLTLVYDVSSDGGTVVGRSLFAGSGFPTATRWFGAAIQDLGLLPGYFSSEAAGVSGDGSVLCGNFFTNGTGIPRAFRWTSSTGVVLLQVSGGPSVSTADAVSGDGRSIVGRTAISGGTLLTNRWNPDGSTTLIGNPPESLFSVSVAGVNLDGTVVLGNSPVGPWRWIEGGTPTMTPPPPGVGATASDMTNEGLAIVGTLEVTPGVFRAGFWTKSTGWLDLADHLQSVGVNMRNWTLTSCVGVSDDGTKLAGTGTYFNQPVAWHVTGIPPLCGPFVQAQPADVTACAFDNPDLTVFAIPPTSPGALSYQWFRYFPSSGFGIALNDGPTGNGSTLWGTDLPGLIFNNVSLADAGTFFCQITGGCATIRTRIVTLTVLPDISGNGGSIDTADLTVILGNFGANVPPWTGGDLNGDGVVNTLDLTTFLGLFGTACP